MKICFILEHFYPHVGGVEIVFSEYAKRLAQKGHEVRVITSNSGKIIGHKKINDIDIYYFDAISFFGHPILFSKNTAPHIQWADIVHTTTYTAAPLAIKLSKKYKKPCVITIHEALRNKWFLIEKNIFKACTFFLFEWFIISRKYSAWHAISMATKEDLKKFSISPEKIFLIYHGIDENIWNKNVEKKNLNKYLEFNEKDKIFLYSGRPGKTKGIFLFLEAINKIKKNIDRKFKFGFILSDDPHDEKERLKQKVQYYKLGEQVHIKDSVSYKELPEYRKSAFAFIAPSFTEGFGFSAAETSALGVPLIVSDAGSLPETTSGKVLFFENGNANDLAEKIILATQNKFKNIPEKKFDWNEAIEKVEKMYKEII